MDLTLPIEDKILNIRVAVILKTKIGYVLEKSKNGYFFVLGGRIKINESSEQAARREVFEETGIKIDDLKLKAVIENFYTNNEERQVQEICFVYLSNNQENMNLIDGLAEYTIKQINDIDLRPTVLKQIILSEGKEISHFSLRS